MTLKSVNLIFKYKNLQLKSVENNNNYKNKSHQHKQVKYNLIKQQNNLKNNMIKDIYYLQNGNKSQKL